LYRNLPGACDTGFYFFPDACIISKQMPMPQKGMLMAKHGLANH
jgi:hypothetical protein